jgi:hypothetical protein
MLLGAVIAFVGGVLVTAMWFKPREQPESAHQKGEEPPPLRPTSQPPVPDQPAVQPPIPEPQAPPKKATPEMRPPSLEEFAAKVAESKKELARLSCRWLSRALEEYANSPRNPGTTKAERLPTSIVDLTKPPFGGPPFLKDALEAVTDPWNKPCQFEQRVRKDGTTYILIHTAAPDGTPISQFGIGPTATPNM